MTAIIYSATLPANETISVKVDEGAVAPRPLSFRWFCELAAATFILGAVFWGPWLYFALTGKPMSFGG